jgi:katanin p60 ATPase-containing subunit A1
MADLQAVKAMSKARDAEERRGQERRRNVVVLILRHLADYGYVDAYERLSAESQLSLGRLDAADNMDLVGILQEFEEGYEQRFGRRPKLVRRVAEEVCASGGGPAAPPAAAAAPAEAPAACRLLSAGRQWLPWMGDS